MKLLLSNPRGFCAGVVRAIRIVERALELYGAPIYVKHEIVHNKHVVGRLKTMGAIFIEDLSDVPKGARLIYSAHGVSPAVRLEAKERGLIEIDATCGLVTKVHSAVTRFAKKGYHVVLIGHKNHVETVGTYGEAPDATTIVEGVEDVAALAFSSDTKLFYATQTTLSLDDIREVVAALKEKFPHIETLPTSSICYATTNRQMALVSICDAVDVVLVVGDPTSSNSNRLCEVAKTRGVLSFLVNDPQLIEEKWLQGARVVGLTAGASTPEDVVQKCIRRLQELGVDEIEDVVYTEEDVIFQLPKALQ